MKKKKNIKILIKEINKNQTNFSNEKLGIEIKNSEVGLSNPDGFTGEFY